MTVSEFIQLEADEVPENLLKVLKRSNTLLGVEADELSEIQWGRVKEIQEAMSDGDIISAVLKTVDHKKVINKSKILGLEYKIFLYFCAWLSDQLEQIGKMEEQLIGETNEDLIEAGVEDLNKFGWINALDSLAGNDITKWQMVYELPYKDVYIKLLKDKETADVQSRFQDIMKRKSKRK